MNYYLLLPRLSCIHYMLLKKLRNHSSRKTHSNMLETKLLFRMKAKDGNLDALNVSNFMRTNRQRKTANFIIGDAQLKKIWTASPRLLHSKNYGAENGVSTPHWCQSCKIRSQKIRAYVYLDRVVDIEWWAISYQHNVNILGCSVGPIVLLCLIIFILIQIMIITLFPPVGFKNNS